MLNEQLAQVPPGVANLQLKRFSLGRQAPIVKAVRFDARRDVICLAPGASSSPPGATLHDKWRAFQHGPGYKPPPAVNSHAAACQHLVADIDFSYLSQDMDIVFSLRSPDVKSVLPEATVRLSEISLSGTFRIDAELTADYPFVGNATISFLRTPLLDTSISSFGGVDLASIPGVYTWINITMSWLLGQFTVPNYGTVDLRRNICPSCDGKPAPSTVEALQVAAEAVQNGIKEGVAAAWAALQAVRKRREAQPQVQLALPSKAAAGGPEYAAHRLNLNGSLRGSGINETGTETAAGPSSPASSMQMLQDALLRSQWSNGTMTLMSLIIIFLLFRLIRKAT